MANCDQVSLSITYALFNPGTCPNDDRPSNQAIGFLFHPHVAIIQSHSNWIWTLRVALRPCSNSRSITSMLIMCPKGITTWGQLKGLPLSFLNRVIGIWIHLLVPCNIPSVIQAIYVNGSICLTSWVDNTRSVPKSWTISWCYLLLVASLNADCLAWPAHVMRMTQWRGETRRLGGLIIKEKKRKYPGDEKVYPQMKTCTNVRDQSSRQINLRRFIYLRTSILAHAIKSAVCVMFNNDGHLMKYSYSNNP